MANLLIIHGSTRPTRMGIKVTRAYEELARERTAFTVEVADLQEIDLPMFNEPHPPRQANYQHDYTKAWAERVAWADAIVFSTAEYNGSFPAALKNAIDYLAAEWVGKPLGINAYGGRKGGLRAAAHLEDVAEMVGLEPVGEPVDFPNYFTHIAESGELEVPEEWVQKVALQLAELERAVSLKDA